MNKNSSSTTMQPGEQAFRWVMFVVTGVLLLVLLWVIIVHAVPDHIDQVAVAGVALSGGAARTMFMFLKWFKKWYLLLLNLLTGGIPFLAAYLVLLPFGPEYAFYLALGGLALGIVVNLIDAGGSMKSVWMWKPRTW